MILYLSNRLVQAVEIKDKNTVLVCQDMAPEGSIINGIVTDEEVFLSWIRNFWTENKLPRREWTLVVNSTQLNSRVLELPKTGNAELRKMIAREFADSRTEQTVFAYHVLDILPGGKMQRVFAVAAEKEFLQAYIRLFTHAGIELISIEPAISNFVRRFSASFEVQKKNSIVQIMDGQEIISILFVKGSYLYSQRNRIFAENDEKALAREAGAVVERILQFASSQHVEDPVEVLYLCGQNQSGLKTAIEENQEFTQKIIPRIYNDDKFKVRKRTGSTEKLEFVYPIGILQKKEKHIDFIHQMKWDSPENIKKRERFVLFLPAIAVFTVCLIIALIQGISYLGRNAELSRLQRTMQENSMVDDHTSYELADANIEGMEKKMEEAGILWRQLMSYPTLTSEIRDVLEGCAGNAVTAEIKSFNRDSGVLSMSASAGDVRDINSFVAALQEQETFEAVEYTGYTLVKGQNNYNIHIVCALAQGAGREEAGE